MIHLRAILALCLLAAPACAGEDDFITPQAGNAVAQAVAAQAEFIWPPNSDVRMIEIPADVAIRRYIASEAAGQAVTSQAAAGSSSSAPASGP